MPTAKVGAPSARARMVDSPTSLAVCTSTSGVMTNPQDDSVCATASGVEPTSAAGLFMAK